MSVTPPVYIVTPQNICIIVVLKVLKLSGGEIALYSYDINYLITFPIG